MSDTIADKDIIARFPGDSYQDLLDRERNPVPDSLREDTAPYLGSESLDICRWTSREFHEKEVRVLQGLCRKVCRPDF